MWLALCQRRFLFSAWVLLNGFFALMLLIGLVISSQAPSSEDPGMRDLGTWLGGSATGSGLLGLMILNAVVALILMNGRPSPDSQAAASRAVRRILDGVPPAKRRGDITGPGPAAVRKAAAGRAHPRLTAEPRVKIPPGEEVVISKLTTEADWARVKRPDGTAWWVETKRLRPREDAASPEADGSVL